MNDSVVVITASSTGIGLGIALQAARQGALCVISSRKQSHVQQALQKVRKLSPKSVGTVCHVGKQDDRKRLIELAMSSFGRIDVLVANAAISTAFGNMLQASEDQINKMWQLNYTSTYSLVKQAIPSLNLSKTPSIIIVSSISAYEPMQARMIAHYGATKAALLYLMKQLAIELPEFKVNAVAPGIIKTRFSEGMWKGREKEVENATGVRLGEVQDVANAVIFLAHPRTTYITGETIIVAGKPTPRL